MLPSRLPRSWPAVATLLMASALRAQSAAPALPAVDARIVHVVTGGYWQSGRQEGRYRAIVMSAGVEHIISHLYIQWVSDETDSTAARVVATRAVDVISEDGWSLDAPDLTRTDERWQVVIEGVDSHFDPPRHGRWIITLGAPGSIIVRQAPRDSTGTRSPLHTQ